jgi:DNA topoisomerase IA
LAVEVLGFGFVVYQLIWKYFLEVRMRKEDKEDVMMELESMDMKLKMRRVKIGSSVLKGIV